MPTLTVFLLNLSKILTEKITNYVHIGVIITLLIIVFDAKGYSKNNFKTETKSSITENSSLPSINKNSIIQSSRLPKITEYNLYNSDWYPKRTRKFIYYLQNIKTIELPNKDKIYDIDFYRVELVNDSYKADSQPIKLVLSEKKWNSCIKNKHVFSIARHPFSSKPKYLAVSMNYKCYEGAFLDNYTMGNVEGAIVQLKEMRRALNNLIKYINTSAGGKLSYIPQK